MDRATDLKVRLAAFEWLREQVELHGDVLPRRLLEDEGDPVVSNGLALCKLHHAAFDSFFLTVRPDYVIEVRRSILEESDGPMLVVGLKQMHGERIQLPRAPVDRPDETRLESRYERFLRAS